MGDSSNNLSKIILKLKEHKRLFKFKDTHREKGPSNKTPMLMKKKMNMDIWLPGHQINFSKKSKIIQKMN